MGMLWDSDRYIGKIVAALKARGMYDNTLIVYTSDNGGTGAGINYPLRGEKHTNWEGGLKTAAFVSGGLIPAAVRGTVSDVNFHIVDWYPTFCVLAGVDPRDDPELRDLWRSRRCHSTGCNPPYSILGPGMSDSSQALDRQLNRRRSSESCAAESSNRCRDQ